MPSDNKEYKHPDDELPRIQKNLPMFQIFYQPDNMLAENLASHLLNQGYAPLLHGSRIFSKEEVFTCNGFVWTTHQKLVRCIKYDKEYDGPVLCIIWWSQKPAEECFTDLYDILCCLMVGKPCYSVPEKIRELGLVERVPTLLAKFSSDAKSGKTTIDPLTTKPKGEPTTDDIVELFDISCK
jgi:hypothetical protein